MLHFLARIIIWEPRKPRSDQSATWERTLQKITEIQRNHKKITEILKKTIEAERVFGSPKISEQPVSGLSGKKIQRARRKSLGNYWKIKEIPRNIQEIHIGETPSEY